MNVLSNRLIAFLDILGFSSRLRTEPLTSLHNLYAGLIDNAQNATFGPSVGDATGRTNFSYSKFLFDSIVLVSHEIDDPYNVNNFLSAISVLQGLGFERQLPLRGAVGIGDFVADEPRGIFLSGAFPEILSLEKELELPVCVLTSDSESISLSSLMGIIDRNHLNLNQRLNSPVHIFRCQTKKEVLDDFIIINYLPFLEKSKISDCLDFLIEPKRSATQDYIDFLSNLPMEYQRLGDEFQPTVAMVPFATRTGVRLIFMDGNKNLCRPGLENFDITAVGRWK